MNNKIILGIAAAAMTALMFTSCSIKNNIGLSSMISPYSKEGESEYNYKINGNKLTINSKVSDLKIAKSDTSEISINMKKAVGGEKEENLQKALDNIKCTYEDDVIKIGPEDGNSSLVNSMNIQTTLNIPNDITSLDITNGVGDVRLEGNYDDLKANLKTGNLSYKGELKECNILSDVGDTKLDLQRLDSNCIYSINGNVGDVIITIPKDSSINLKGSSIKKSVIGDGIKLDDNSATFDINRKVSNLKIATSSK